MEVLVEYDYVAQNPDELSIKKGERIRNVQRKEEGWYEGELASSGRRGVFPDNFVKPLKTNSITQKMAIQKQQVKSPENLKKNTVIGFKGVDSLNNSNGNGFQSGKFNNNQQQQPIPASSPPPPPPPSSINSNNLNNINNKSNPPLPIRKPLKRNF